MTTYVESRAAATTAVEDEFAALYAEHFGRLSGYALSLIGDPGHASDVAQEAFTRLYARWGRVRDPRAWLYFVATNLATDSWRRLQRDRALTASLATVSVSGTDPHDPWLRDLVDRLAPRLRDVVLLHYYADLPVEQVALLLHRPVGTVKRRLHEARAALLASGADHD